MRLVMDKVKVSVRVTDSAEEHEQILFPLWGDVRFVSVISISVGLNAAH